MKTISLAAATVLLSSGAALAHPGEHAFSAINSFVHLLTEPDHLAMIAGAAALAYGLYALRRRRSV